MLSVTFQLIYFVESTNTSCRKKLWCWPTSILVETFRPSWSVLSVSLTTSTAKCVNSKISWKRSLCLTPPKGYPSIKHSLIHSSRKRYEVSSFTFFQCFHSHGKTIFQNSLKVWETKDFSWKSGTTKNLWWFFSNY